MVMLIVRPAYFLDSASRGLLLFATSVLPAVFPFFFCASLLTALGAANSVSRLAARPVAALFRSPPSGAYVFTLSLLSGYPIGAATVADLCLNGVINRSEAKKIASFTSTSGPVFVLGTVGSVIFGDPACGALLLIAHYASALVTGLVFRGRKTTGDGVRMLSAERDADGALSRSIASSSLAMLAVGGYIVVGNMLIDAIALSGVFESISSSCDPTAAGCVKALLSGGIEMTRGTMEAAKIPCRPLALAVACAVISFGGLSVIMQSHAFLSKCGIPLSALLGRKAVQCVAAFILAFVFSLIYFTIFDIIY